ncbi:hypothetical protein [Pseudomonas entomophila]|uniref:hypothetical protein n=1 Tax=Pseudomonas entomophila TaxID=312306 RepID=UPI001F0104EA|nr:hypothetical protein [Pseudomonas entomophila]MCG8296309.1 hypothetical protein [Pseudomonas entomophila]
MRDLEIALQVLKSAHAKYHLPGVFRSGRGAETDWPASIPAARELVLFYNECEPLGVKLETGLTPLKLMALDDLEKAQVGYRWSNAAGGLVTFAAWPEQHVVIMDDIGGGKPLIAVTGEPGLPVYANYGAGPPFEVAAKFADLLIALARLIDIVHGEFCVFDVFDDDGVVEAFRSRTQAEIEPVLGAENFGRFFDYFYG